MRISVYYGGRLGESRGTPSRARNMALALAGHDGVAVATVSRDPVLDLPGVRHVPLIDGDLGDLVRDFNPDVLYGHTHKALPVLASVTGCLAVADLHGNSIAEKLEERERPWSRRLRSAARLWWIEQRYLNRIDACTTVSRQLATRAERRGVRSQVVWGGVDPELFVESPGAPGDELVLGYAGNFRSYQGLPQLLEAIERLEPRPRAILVGDAGETGVDHQARELLGDRLTLTGPLPYDEVPRALEEANVLLIPRPDSATARAGFPSKLPEYMALGKALVVTDVGDQGSVVEHMKSGWVVPPGRVDALARALGALRDPAVRAMLGRGARAKACNELDWRVIAGDILGYFRELLDAERRTSP